MVSSTLCPALHILGSQNVYSRAEGIADHYWPWTVFFLSDPYLLPPPHPPPPLLFYLMPFLHIFTLLFLLLVLYPFLLLSKAIPPSFHPICPSSPTLSFPPLTTHILFRYRANASHCYKEYEAFRESCPKAPGPRCIASDGR